MRVLVTGGCGYVGTPLTQALLSRTDHAVTVLDALWFGNRLAPQPRLTVCQMDMRQIDEVDLTPFDTIFHLANIANDPAADTILEPIGINDFSLQGVDERLRAIRGVVNHNQRAEPQFPGLLLPSIYDHRSRRERQMFEELARQVGKLLFPGIVAKHNLYCRAAGEGEPVRNVNGVPAREAGDEIRRVLKTASAIMALPS